MEYIVLVEVSDTVEVYRRDTAGANQLVGSAVKPTGLLASNAYVAPACQEVVWFDDAFDEASGTSGVAPASRSGVSTGSLPAPLSFSGPRGTDTLLTDKAVVLWDAAYLSSSAVFLDPPTISADLGVVGTLGSRLADGAAVAVLSADGEYRVVWLDDLGTTGYVSTPLSAPPLATATTFTPPNLAGYTSDIAAAAAVIEAASAAATSPIVLSNSARILDGVSGPELRTLYGFAHNLADKTVEHVATIGVFPPHTYSYRKYTVNTALLTATLDDEQTIDAPRNAYYVAPALIPAFWTNLRKTTEAI